VGWTVVRQLGVIAALLLVAVILWIDFATGIWQDYVVLSGLAAGLVTFVLTALIVDRVVARATHKRWAPVTRLALTDILHSLADDEASEIAHGKVVTRLIDPVTPPGTVEAISRVRHDVVAERRRLADVLAQWSMFLASSADATDVLDHAAEIAERLDMIRDAAIEAESGIADPDTASPSLVELNGEIDQYNSAVQRLVAELRRLIEETNRLTRADTRREAPARARA